MTGWWRRRNQAERFDLYTRWSLYALSAGLPLLLMLTVAANQDSGDGLATMLVLGLAHTVICLFLLRAGFAYARGARPMPTVAIAVAGGLTVAGAALAVAVLPRSAADELGPVWGTTMLMALGFVAALSVIVRLRVAAAVVVLAAVANVLLLRVDGAPNSMLTGATISLLAGALSAAVGYRASMWMLGIVWELDRSRGVQARLAVAEERLRFSRDLHDVLGRNLSVVALKSELAAQLAKRDQPEAVEEMLEVHRIAEESLAEVREVVRGYRAADLDAELAGARSVLASAGVACRVLGDGRGLPVDVQSTLGWVVREGTTNVLRHSDARESTVSVRRDETGGVVLTMDNDGVRASPAGRPEYGSGMVGLTERLAAMGGTVEVEHRPRGWFRLVARLPANAVSS